MTKEKKSAPYRVCLDCYEAEGFTRPHLIMRIEGLNKNLFGICCHEDRAVTVDPTGRKIAATSSGHTWGDDKRAGHSFLREITKLGT